MRAGPKIATDTGTFDIPFRPSASPECADAAPGAWYFVRNGTGTCHYGYPANITFSNFTFSNGFAPGQPLPARLSTASHTTLLRTGTPDRHAPTIRPTI